MKCMYVCRKVTAGICGSFRAASQAAVPAGGGHDTIRDASGGDFF